MSNEAIIHRIRALLAKTTSNGCTEAEAMMAASKAAELMDQHDIQTIDLGEKSVFVEFTRKNIRHDIMKRRIAWAVTQYCGCYMIFIDLDIRVMGRDIDVVMAEWLFDTLVEYVTRGLKTHMSGKHSLPSAQKTQIKNGFIIGAANRIAERLTEMMKVRVVQSNALVLSKGKEAKNAFVKKFTAEGGKINGVMRPKKVYYSRDSLSAGQEHGDRANLSRPLSSSKENIMIG